MDLDFFVRVRTCIRQRVTEESIWMLIVFCVQYQKKMMYKVIHAKTFVLHLFA